MHLELPLPILSVEANMTIFTLVRCKEAKQWCNALQQLATCKGDVTPEALAHASFCGLHAPQVT